MATEGGETESPPVEATDIGSYMFLQKIVVRLGDFFRVHAYMTT